MAPPFRGDDRRNPLRGLRAIPVRMVLPSAVTLVALCAGLTAIRMSIEGRYDWAIGAIAIAALLDGIDGRVARFLKSMSRFGAELDSLTDFVNFGVAPAILLYVWALHDLKNFGWIAALIFAICTALRLARFNVALEGPEKPEWQSNYFTGMPSPAGALTVLLPISLEFTGLPHGGWMAPIAAVYTLAIGLLMVSQVPTWSGKLIGHRIPREYVLPLLVVLVIGVALLLSFPWETMALIIVGYLATLPLSWRAYRRRLASDANSPPPQNEATPSVDAPPEP